MAGDEGPPLSYRFLPFDIHMARSYRVALSAVMLWTVVACGGDKKTTGGASVPADIWQGVYTDAQAARGLQIYSDHCVICHGADMSGVDTTGAGDYGEPSPPLAGPLFLAKWNKKGLDEILTLIQTEMPKNAKGTVKPQRNADALAFILQQNGFPSGPTELPTRAAALMLVKLQTRTTSGAANQ